MPKERDFQTKFSKWLRYQDRIGNAVFELKIVKGDSMPFDRVADHQVEALYHASREFIVYKIPDDTIGQKPFDCFKITRADAYVVIYFYKHANREFFLINIHDFIAEKNESTRRSLTRDRAMQIGDQYLFPSL